MMKRTLLIVAILALSVAPAMAAVTVSAIQEVPATPGGPYSAARKCNVVDINYVCTAGERVRAFAVEVNVDNGFIISAVTDYNTGESSALPGKKVGHGIFPGSFRDVINPASPNWVDTNYKPVAPATDVDANGTGLGTRKVILELGSLYVGESNKPAASGTLCKLVITPPRPGIDCNLQLTVSTTRGGVVLEDGTTVTPTLVARGLVAAGKVSFPECFPCWAPYDVVYSTDFLGTWKPNCWCGQYALTDSNGPRSFQCLGDTDGKTEGISKFRVYSSDYSKLAASWAKKATQLKSINNGFCADFDHKAEGISKFRVYSSDYTKLVQAWAKKDTSLKVYGTCPQP